MIQVKDLTVDELKAIISETVKDSLQDIVEKYLILL